MGKLAGWSFHHSENSKCGKCGMKTHESDNDGCCKDIHKQIKNDNDQKITETGLSVINLLSAAVISYPITFSQINISSVTETSPVSNAPPRSEVPIYLRNRVFRI
jgi:hypothetical protein